MNALAGSVPEAAGSKIAFRQNGGKPWVKSPEAQKTVLPAEWRKSAPEAYRKRAGSSRKNPLYLRYSACARVRRGAAHEGKSS